MSKKATVDNLLRLGLDNTTKRHGTIEVLGLQFEYDKMPIMAMLDIVDEYDDTTKGQLELALEVTYMTIPVFRDKKLQEQFKVSEPHDVILKVLGDNLNAVTELGKAVMNLYNMSDTIEDTKK